MTVKCITIFCMLTLVLLILGCDGPTESVIQDKFKVIVLESDGVLPPEFCLEKRLKDKIIMLESKYCGHCKVAMPILKDITKEKKVEILFLDVSKEEDRSVLESYSLSIKYTPTLLVGCNVFIGGKSKEEYVQIIDGFIEKR